MRTLQESILGQDYDVSENAALANVIWKDIEEFGWTITGKNEATCESKGILDSNGLICDLYSRLTKYIVKRKPHRNSQMARVSYNKHENWLNINSGKGPCLEFRPKMWRHARVIYYPDYSNGRTTFWPWKPAGYLPIEVVDIIRNNLGLL